MNQYNLDHAIWDAKNDKARYERLNEKQIEAFLSLIGKGCRQNTKEKLARRISIPLSFWNSYGIFSRVILTDDDVDYICGQSWNDEMRTLRECIL